MEAVVSLLKPAMDYWMLTDRFAHVEGFLDSVEGYALHLLAAFGPGEGAVVEIGSLYGRSTCYLASGCERNGRGSVVAVDTFEGSPEHQSGGKAEQEAIVQDGTTLKVFLRNMALHRLDGFVKPVVKPSLAAAGEWSGDIRLLFIDGDHSYEESRADFEAWTPHLAPGGLVCLHDVNTWDGVTKFYQEITAAGQWAQVLSAGTMRVLQRV